MKMILLSFIAVCGLATLTGCSCDEKRSSSYESASLTTDSKDMDDSGHHHHHHPVEAQ
jgi:uncharacterized protein YceK